MGEKKLRYFNLPEASEYSRIPVSTLRKRIHEGLLPAYKPGKEVLVDPKDLDLFIKKSKI